jgi:hypothetical protein
MLPPVALQFTRDFQGKLQVLQYRRKSIWEIIRAARKKLGSGVYRSFEHIIDLALEASAMVAIKTDERRQ